MEEDLPKYFEKQQKNAKEKNVNVERLQMLHEKATPLHSLIIIHSILSYQAIQEFKSL